MSEPKPMSPLEKIKALKAEAEAKKSREAQEAAERAAKEQNEKQEKLLEARKKFGEAQKLVDECSATYNETAEEMKGIEDTELLGQISAIVEESRAAKESAEAALREASDALENLERLESNKDAAPENSPVPTPESPTQHNVEHKEREPDFLHYESRVDGTFHLSAFSRENDFQKMLSGEQQNLKFPEDAARIVGEVNKLRREPYTRNQEREALKKDVEQYLSAHGLSEIFAEADTAKTKPEKEAVLNKLNKLVAQIDGYVIKMFTITKGGESNTPDYTMPQGDDRYMERNTNLYELPDYHKPNMAPITREQMLKLETILGNLQNEAKKIRESIT